MVSVALLQPEAHTHYRSVPVRRGTWITTGSRRSATEIEFWRKVFLPLSCFVMVVLALPFAYTAFQDQAGSSFCLWVS
jgi:lipopolysaccharide export system permease protein